LEKCILGLESNLGEPVELSVSLCVKTPTGEDKSLIGTYGNLRERPLEVKRVEGLGRDYKNDIRLLEGKYTNLRALEEKVNGLDLIYGVLHYTSDAIHQQRSADGRVMREFRLQNERVPLAFNLHYHDDPSRDLHGNVQKGLISRDKVFDLLRREKFSFLEYNYRVGVDGIYVVSRTSEKIGGQTISAQNKIKVADVKISLLPQK